MDSTKCKEKRETRKIAVKTNSVCGLCMFVAATVAERRELASNLTPKAQHNTTHRFTLDYTMARLMLLSVFGYLVIFELGRLLRAELRATQYSRQ